MESEKKYVGGWFMWILGLLVVASLVGGGMKILGVFGERVVFEQSFQYKEARKTEVATFEAQLAEIDRLLSSDIDSTTRANMESQAASIRIQLSVARGK